MDVRADEESDRMQTGGTRNLRGPQDQQWQGRQQEWDNRNQNEYQREKGKNGNAFSEETRKRTVRIVDPLSAMQREEISKLFHSRCNQSRTTEASFVECQSEEKARELLKYCEERTILARITWEKDFTLVINLKRGKTREEEERTIEEAKPLAAFRNEVVRYEQAIRIYLSYECERDLFQTWANLETRYDLWLPTGSQETLKEKVAVISHSEKYNDENRFGLKWEVTEEVRKTAEGEIIAEPIGKSGCTMIYFEKESDKINFLKKGHWRNKTGMAFWSEEKKKRGEGGRGREEWRKMDGERKFQQYDGSYADKGRSEDRSGIRSADLGVSQNPIRKVPEKETGKSDTEN